MRLITPPIKSVFLHITFYKIIIGLLLCFCTSGCTMPHHSNVSDVVVTELNYDDSLTKDGIIFEKSQTTLIKYPQEKAGSYKIPLCVSVIGKNSFNGCTGLTIVTIPSSVKCIEDGAFDGCSNLKAFIVDATNPYYASHDGVLFNKDKTVLIKYPCKKNGTYSIPPSVIIIGDMAFFTCAELISIILPASVEKIGNSAFEYCEKLTGFVVNANNAHYSSQDGVLFNKDKTILIKYPPKKAGSYSVPTSVINIEKNAFSACTRLTNIDSFGAVKNIDDGAFHGCSGLTNVTIPSNLTYVGSNVFANCERITSVSIFSNIGYSSFFDCSALNSVIIYPGVTNIGIATFSGCTSLMNVILPCSLKSIESYAFVGCSSLKTVIIPASVTCMESDVFSECNSLTAVYFKGNAPFILHDKKMGIDGRDSFLPIVYYRNGTSGWSASYCGWKTVPLPTDSVLFRQAQTINFAAISLKILGEKEFTPVAISSSGLQITYTSSNPAVAIIVNGNIHIVGTGVTTITATQAGDANYLEAQPIMQSLTVKPSCDETVLETLQKH